MSFRCMSRGTYVEGIANKTGTDDQLREEPDSRFLVEPEYIDRIKDCDPDYVVETIGLEFRDNVVRVLQMEARATGGR